MKLAQFALLTGLVGLPLTQAAVQYIGVTPTNDATTTTIVDLSTDPTGTWGGSYDAATKTWFWDHADGVILENIVTITGGTLMIPEGTIVRGQPRGAAYNPGALLIARNAKLIAQGNSSNPIVFTTASIGTPTNETGTRASGGAPVFWDNDPKVSPKTPTIAGIWGGVLVLGNASTNADRTGQTGFQRFFEEGYDAANTDDRSSVEGIPGLSSAGLAGLDRFGGHKDNDNSGIISYVSIRHGGAKLASDAEINGLTVGGLGNGTTINNVEIWGNTDDGVEIFGGTVNLNNIVIVAPQDDGLDLDVGYRGTVQNLLVIGANLTDKLGEWDGDYTGETVNGFPETPLAAGGPVATNGLPYSAYTIANATFIGNPAVSPGNNFTNSLHLRDQTNARVVNSIFVNLGSNAARGPIMVNNPTTGTAAVSPRRTTDGFVFGRSYFKGVTFDGAQTTADALVNFGQVDSVVIASLETPDYANLFGVSVGFQNVPTGGTLPTNQLLDPRPTQNADAVLEDAVVGASGNYVFLPYRGAFDPSLTSLWTAGWTAADAYNLVIE